MRLITGKILRQKRRLSIGEIVIGMELAKKNAAFKAVDSHVKSNSVIGIGSGSTIVYAVMRLAELHRSAQLDVRCLASSFQAKQLILEHKLPLTDLDSCPKIDCYIDGADEVDDNFVMIKGGGGCLLQEKILASCAREVVIVADWTKNVVRLGDNYKKGIPIEVLPLALNPVRNRLSELFPIGQFRLRSGVAKAGPCVTDNGNFILDWIDFPQNDNWTETQKTIKLLPGVIECGIFDQFVPKVYFGMPDGSVTEKKRR